MVTAKVPAEPFVKPVSSADVNEGASSTVRVKSCVTVAAMFVAASVNWYTPPAPSAGVPEIVAVPLPLSVRTRPLGRGPDPDWIVSVGVGVGVGVPPIAFTVNEPDVPTVKVALAALWKSGAMA